MPSDPSVPWSSRLHALWRAAFRAVNTKDFSQELYFGLLALPGARAVLGVRLTPAGGVRVTRWADAEGLATGPAGLTADIRAWTEVRSASGPDSIAIAELAREELPDGLAGRLDAVGASRLLVATFTVARDERGVLAVALADGPPDAETTTALRQASEVVVAADRRTGEQAALEDHQARDAILAEASLRMDASLDIEDTLRAVVRMAVPGLADGAVLHLARDGEMVRIAVAHVDARREQLLADHLAAGRWAGDPVVTRADRSPWDDEPRPSGLPADTGLDRMTISVLRARGRDVGLLTFLHRRGSVRRTSGDFLRDLASRAALSIDNATLYDDRRRDVLSLQQHLLPSVLPEVPGLQFATGYTVADNRLDVGGDFYTVVDQPQGKAVALIGDVCGRGAPAAAVTGLARHTLETVLAEGRSPEHALNTLNTKMLRQRITRFLTVASATFGPAEPGDPAGLRVRTLAAGHPQPMIVRRDGGVEEPGCTGRLLGVLPDLRLSAAGTRLKAGDSVILYTDGLIEARDDAGRFFGDADFTSTLTRLRGLPLPDLVDSLLVGAGRYRVGDDAAVLAVRSLGVRALNATLPVEEVHRAARAAVGSLRPDGRSPDLPEHLDRFLADSGAAGVDKVLVTVDGDATWSRVEITPPVGVADLGTNGSTAWAELTT